MKRILSVILIIMLALSCVSCGNKEEKAASADNRQESGSENVSENKEDKAQGNETGETVENEAIETGGAQIEYGKIKESDLPRDKYRTDLVPILKDSVIISTMVNTDFNLYEMLCYSKKPYDEVKAYYQEIMSEYTITYEEEINNENLYDAPTYLLEAETSDEISVFVMITDLTQIPENFRWNLGILQNSCHPPPAASSGFIRSVRFI